jgi:hypothetical protein
VVVEFGQEFAKKRPTGRITREAGKNQTIEFLPDAGAQVSNGTRFPVSLRKWIAARSFGEW